MTDVYMRESTIRKIPSHKILYRLTRRTEKSFDMGNLVIKFSSRTVNEVLFVYCYVVESNLLLLVSLFDLCNEFKDRKQILFDFFLSTILYRYLNKRSTFVKLNHQNFNPAMSSMFVILWYRQYKM